MKELTVTKNDAGQRLDRFLAKAVPLLPASREFDSCKQAQRPERLVWPNIFCQI